jgi:steroid delta-isomerase-like uncharacterized protein
MGGPAEARHRGISLSSPGKEVAVTRPQEIMRGWQEAFNAHDEGAMRSLLADDVHFEVPGDVRLEGADATVEYAMSWLRAFPDAQMTVETEVAERDWVVRRFVFEGKHEGTLTTPTGEIPATGERLVGRGVEVTRISGDEITEDYLYFDQMQVLTQLGLAPELAMRAT